MKVKDMIVLAKFVIGMMLIAVVVKTAWVLLQTEVWGLLEWVVLIFLTTHLIGLIESTTKPQRKNDNSLKEADRLLNKLEEMRKTSPSSAEIEKSAQKGKEELYKKDNSDGDINGRNH